MSVRVAEVIPGREDEWLHKVVAKPSMNNHNYTMRPGLFVLDSTSTRLHHKEVDYSYDDVEAVDALLRA